MVHRSRLVHDDAFGLVIGHVDNVIFDRRNLDAAVVTRHRLVRVALQVAGRVSAVAKVFYRADDIGLLGDHGLAEAPGPVQVLVEQFHDLRIVEQRDDRVVPGIVGLQRRVLFKVFEESLRLDELQRVGRCRQHNRQQVVWIKSNGTDQFLKLRLRQERNVLIPGRRIRFEGFIVRERSSARVDRHLCEGGHCNDDRNRRHHAG